MRIKHLAAITFVAALGCTVLAGSSEAQVHVDPYAAQPVVEESTLPASEFSAPRASWQFWAASLVWTHSLQSPMPILPGAALPTEWWDRSLRRR